MHLIYKANGNKIASFNITNKISKSVLVAVFSSCIREPAIASLWVADGQLLIMWNMWWNLENVPSLIFEYV